METVMYLTSLVNFLTSSVGSGYTQAEIAEQFGSSTRTVQRWLAALADARVDLRVGWRGRQKVYRVYPRSAFDRPSFRNSRVKTLRVAEFCIMARIMDGCGWATAARLPGTPPLHDFHALLVIALCATLCGGQGAVDMALFVRAKEPFLREFLDLKNGTPSHDTFSRLFRALDPDRFRTAFQRFMTAFPCGRMARSVTQWTSPRGAASLACSIAAAPNVQSIRMACDWASYDNTIRNLLVREMVG